MTRHPRRTASPLTAPPRAATAPVPQAEPLEPRTHLSASLVADVQQGSGDASPTVLTAGPARLFFRALDGTTVGNEPYTLAGQFPPSQAPRATLLKDINPNGDSIYRNFGSGAPPPPTPAIAAGDGFYFSAYAPSHGLELWHTDGTAAGTRMVKDVFAGFGNAAPDRLFLAGDTLYFGAEVYAPPSGAPRQLWKTDGTDAGTVPVLDAALRSPMPEATSMALLNGVVYFTTAAGVWRVDPAGAVPVKTQPPSPGVAPARSLVAFGGALYYKYGTQLWRSDGTTANTAPIATVGIVSPTHVQSFDGLVPAGDFLYFVGNTAEAGAELWRTDGSADGTHVVKELHAGATGSWPNHLTDVNGSLYFTASASGTDPGTPAGEYVWKTHGTAESTVALRSVYSGVSPAARPVGQLAAVGDTLYFTIERLTGTAGLWRSDGTPEGTTRVDAPMSDPQSLTPFAGRLHFVARNIDGLELWSTDGTTAGTAQVQDLNARHRSDRSAPEGLSEINGRVVFASDDGVTGRKLWSSDGTPGGTVAILDFPRHYSVHPFKPVRLGDRLYFPSGLSGSELWSTDGTATGTGKIKTFLGDTSLGGIGRLSSVAGMLLFFAADAQHGRELWTSDGTVAGTRLLKEFVPGPAGTYGQEDLSWPRTIEAGGLAWFTHGGSIWKTDGTPENTVAVRSFTTSNPDRPVALGNRVIFTLPYSGAGPRDQLWATDGTPEGTTLLRENFTAHSFAALGDFVAFWGEGGLWRSDGTPAGTYAIWEYENGVMANPNNFFAWNGALYFRADNGTWKTDGTRAGTVPLMTADGVQARLGGYRPFGDHLYAANVDPAHGSELWRTDGTAAGTMRLTDILPGPASSSPSPLVPMGDALYFFAEDGIHGRELWRYVPGAPAVTVAGRHVFYNNSAYDNRDPAATLADLAAIAPDKHALRPGGAASFGNVTSYTRGLNGVLVDFAGIPPVALTAADFEFRAGRLGDPSAWSAVTPASVTQLIGPVASNAARYAITFPDGAVRNAWLRVTVKANPNTGLGADDVFYYGNLVGDTGHSPLRVDASDYIVTLGNLNKTAGLPAKTDFDRNGRTNSVDLLIARQSRGGALSRLEPPSPIAPAGSALAPLPPRRRAAYEIL